jgi:rod shape-determining protein MreD
MVNSEVGIKYKTLMMLIVINYILQSTVLQSLKIAGVSANFTLILVIVVTIVYGIEKGLFAAVVSGLFVDVFLSMAVGLNLFILVIITVLISIIGRPLFTGNKLTLVFMTAISTVIYHLMYFFFMYFLNKGVSISEVMTQIVPIEIVYNSIVCVMAYQVSMRWIERYKLD